MAGKQDSQRSAIERFAQIEAERRALEFQHAETVSVAASAAQAAGVADAIPQSHTPVTRDQPKVGRNDPCPCGSGKKYKQCHGRLA